jgi:hypothetical protein
MRVCRVPTCPAEAVAETTVCGIHRFAQIATKEVWSQGNRALDLSCESRRRKFRKGDWIYVDEPLRHVRCEPPTVRVTRQALMESPKPLLDVGNDAPVDRR